MLIYLKLFLMSLIPISLAIGFFFLLRNTKFKNIPYKYQQIIIGVAFGLAAVCATEFGVKVEVETITIDGAIVNSATANVRDASPLLAGLVFGGPAGIIAGVIGGVERFCAAYWGKGALTQIACSVSTIIAGLYAAAMRKYFFKNKRVKWWFAVAIAVVMEVFHFVMVFILKLSYPTEIMKIIKALCSPMIIASAFALFVPTFVIQVIHHKENPEKHKYNKISTQVQWWLLISIVASYAVSSLITYAVETNTAFQEANSTFNLTLDDVRDNVVSSSNEYLTNKLEAIRSEVKFNSILHDDVSSGFTYFQSLCTDFGVYSVDLIDSSGTFVHSSAQEVVTFNMNNSENESKIQKMMNEKDFDDDPYIREFEPNGDEGKMVKYAYISMGDGTYLAIGLDQDQFYLMINNAVEDITAFRHVLNNGYILIYDWYGDIISVLPDKEGIPNLSMETITKKDEFVRGKAKVYNESSFYMYTTAETYTLVVVLPYNDVLFNRDSQFMLNSFMEVLVFGALFMLIYYLLDKSVVSKIEKINNGLGEITKGDLNLKVDVKSSREFASLSDGINVTVDALKGYIDAANKRIDEELAFAKSIQTSVLPSAFPAFPDRKEFDIHASMHTAKEVGGDFYDFYFSGGDNFHITIADVSGKGIPAALFMMRSKQALKSLSQTNIPIDQVFATGNNNLCDGNDAGMFVTAWSANIDLKTGKTTFANGGHNPPLIKRANGKFEYLRSRPNMVLAAYEGAPYGLNELDLNVGDTLFLYTDGVTEAVNTKDEQFGENRLQEVLNSRSFNSDKEICDFVYEKVNEFADGAAQFDDITMLAFTYKGK